MAQLATLPVAPAIFILIILGIFALLLFWIESAMILSAAFILICLLLMLMILIQRPRGGGLSGAFGGAGGAQDAFGSKAGDMATWVTVGLFVAFLALSVKLTFATRPEDFQPTPQQVAPAGGTAPVEAPPEDPATGPQAPADTEDTGPETTPDADAGDNTTGEPTVDEAPPATEPADSTDPDA